MTPRAPLAHIVPPMTQPAAQRTTNVQPQATSNYVYTTVMLTKHGTQLQHILHSTTINNSLFDGVAVSPATSHMLKFPALLNGSEGQE